MAAQLSDSDSGYVFVVNAAASTSVASLPIYQADGTGTKMVSLIRNNMPRASKLSNQHAPAHLVGNIQTLPIDLFLEGNASKRLRVSLLKVDAQGYELNVLRGSSKFLDEQGRVDAVQCEFCPLMLYESEVATRPTIMKTSANHSSNSSIEIQADRRLAAVSLLELMRDSGRMCFQISNGIPLHPTNSLSFEDFVDAHLDPVNSTCPVLGCATEILCLPFCTTEEEKNDNSLALAEHVLAFSQCRSPNISMTTNYLRSEFLHLYHDLI